MPLPLLAHQAPVLPLKLRWPSAWNGTALVIGSIAPDLEYLRMAGPADRYLFFAHSIAGQLAFCLPFTLGVVLLVGRLRLGDVLVARLRPRPRARLAWLRTAATDVSRPGGLLRAGASALVGSFSHIALDALTHTWLPRWLPARTFHFAGVHCGTATLVQLVASLLGSVTSVWLLWLIARKAPDEELERRPGAVVVGALAFAGALLGVLRAAPAMREPDAYFDAGRLYIWGLVAFFAACGAGAGVLVAGVGLAAWDRAARRP